MHVETRFISPNNAYTRLLYGAALSFFFHLAVITLVGGVHPKTSHRPLVAELWHVPVDDAGPLTMPENVSENVIDNPLPHAPAPQIETPLARSVPMPEVDLPIPLQTYLNVDEVDVRAEPANDVPLSYPIVAYMQRMQGVVRLNLFINEHGKLDRIDLVDASPKGVFEQAAIEAASKLYFHPAIRHGHAVKSQKSIEVVFDPHLDIDSAKPTPPKPTPSATEK